MARTTQLRMSPDKTVPSTRTRRASVLAWSWSGSRRPLPERHAVDFDRRAGLARGSRRGGPDDRRRFRGGPWRFNDRHRRVDARGGLHRGRRLGHLWRDDRRSGPPASPCGHADHDHRLIADVTTAPPIANQRRRGRTCTHCESHPRRRRGRDVRLHRRERGRRLRRVVGPPPRGPASAARASREPSRRARLPCRHRSRSRPAPRGSVAAQLERGLQSVLAASRSRASRRAPATETFSLNWLGRDLRRRTSSSNARSSSARNSCRLVSSSTAPRRARRHRCADRSRAPTLARATCSEPCP